MVIAEKIFRKLTQEKLLDIDKGLWDQWNSKKLKK